MKHLFLFALVAFSFQTMAYYEPSSRVLPLRDRFTVSTAQDEIVSIKAQNLVGHLSLAVQSIDWQIKDSAQDHLKKARASAQNLLASQKLESTTIKNLPFSRMDMDQTDADYYAPIWISEAVEQEVEQTKSLLRPRTQVLDARIVTTTMQFNLKSTLLHIANAEKLLLINDLQNSRSEIVKVLEEGLVTETVIDDPTFTVWANIVVASDFIQMEDYKNARFTMGKAREGLKRLEKDKVLRSDSAAAKQLHTELENMAKILDERSPTVMTKIKNQLKSWKLKIKNWV